VRKARQRRVQPTVEQDQHQRDGTEPKGERVVVERDADHTFRPRRHAEHQEDHQHRHAEPLRERAGDHRDDQQHPEDRQQQRSGQRLHGSLVSRISPRLSSSGCLGNGLFHRRGHRGHRGSQRSRAIGRVSFVPRLALVMDRSARPPLCGPLRPSASWAVKEATTACCDYWWHLIYLVFHKMSEPIPPPNARLLLLEGRALFELGALLPAYPFLRRAPSGDGHPVLVLPGFMAGDFSTRTLRRFLRDKGYMAHGWKLGRNRGPSAALMAAMVARVQQLHARRGRRVSLVGWSLGGIYARDLAGAMPELVRQVITLASPFRDLDAVNVPNFLRGRARRRTDMRDDTQLRARLREPLPVPTTAIVS